MTTVNLRVAPVNPLGCHRCAFRSLCGGLEQQSLWGCFANCGACGVAEGKCDYSCPRKRDFFRDWAEVGGLAPAQRRELPPLELDLPKYVPMIRRRAGRRDVLPIDLVAVNTFDVIGKRCRTRDLSGEALRARLLLPPDARVILVSANEDGLIEGFWANRDAERLRALARLDACAITTPNYSFFDDAPRLHSVRNFWRIRRAAEDLADAGLSPIFHVNATCREDWKRWAVALRENPSIRYVCKEFQTGLLSPMLARDAIDGLAWLQDTLGRSLHPIVVGARRILRELDSEFASYTLVDSVPYFATVKRKRIVINGASARQIDNPTATGEPLDALLQDNLRSYRHLVETCSANVVDVPEDFDDVDEPFAHNAVEEPTTVPDQREDAAHQ